MKPNPLDAIPFLNRCRKAKLRVLGHVIILLTLKAHEPEPVQQSVLARETGIPDGNLFILLRNLAGSTPAFVKLVQYPDKPGKFIALTDEGRALFDPSTPWAG